MNLERPAKMRSPRALLINVHFPVQEKVQNTATEQTKKHWFGLKPSSEASCLPVALRMSLNLREPVFYIDRKQVMLASHNF